MVRAVAVAEDHDDNVVAIMVTQDLIYDRRRYITTPYHAIP